MQVVADDPLAFPQSARHAGVKVAAEEVQPFPALPEVRYFRLVRVQLQPERGEDLADRVQGRPGLRPRCGSACGHLTSTWKVTVNQALARGPSVRGRVLPGVLPGAGSSPQGPQACEVALSPPIGSTTSSRRSVIAVTDKFVTSRASCNS